jgi:hypothetical protein
MVRATLIVVLAALALVAFAAPNCLVMTPLGHINVTSIEPTVWLTDVHYALGIKLQWYIGVSPCNLQNKTLPANKTCAPGYGFAVSPLSYFPECAEVFPDLLEVWWSNGEESLKIGMENPADGRIVNVTIKCNASASAGIDLTAPIRSPDAHRYYIEGQSSNACASF